jgi:hypothetical protein
MPRRSGRPGLIGTAARTAVIAGTAQAVAGNVAQKQQAQAAKQAEAAASTASAEAPAAGGTDELMEKMAQLAKLHAAGILTDDEFAAAKAKALGI